MNIIYYHSADHDGKASGAIAFNALNRNAKLIGIDYGAYDFNNEFDSWKEDDVVYLLDFSFDTRENMLKAFEKLGNGFIFIDHHKTAIEAIEGLPIKGNRQVGVAACKLCWGYFHPDKEIPEAIELLARYDVFDLNPRVERFQLGMELLETNPESQNWLTLFKSDKSFVDDIVNQGNTIIKYVRANDARFSKSFSFDGVLDGHNAIIINHRGGSKTFDSVWDDNKHAIMVAFLKMPSDDRWKISLYSKENGPDVSEIAKKHGGGGHAHAAGFNIKTKELIEMLNLTHD